MTRLFRRYGPMGAIVVGIGLSHTAHAQFRASIQGTVSDPTGAVIPGATLTLVDLGTNESRTVQANDNGVYSFPQLPPDRFRLTATAPGFKQQVIDNLSITPEAANSVPVQMAIGTETTTVTVAGNSIPAIDTETANLQGNITSDEVQHLPSAGRDVFQLAQLAPGSFGDMEQSANGGTNSLPGTQGPGGAGSAGIFSTENGPQVLAGGGQYETNGISIDGISVSSAVWGGTSIITPSEDSVGNVTVVSNAYDATNGRFSGAQIEVTSKSGTNQPHGSFFFRAARPGLNAYQRWNGPNSEQPAATPAARGLIRNSQRYNQYGGSIGGPFWKDHLFGFFAFETERNDSAVTSTGWYDTAGFDALAPSGSIAAQFLGFAGNVPSVASMINATCGTAGLTEGVNCRTIAGQGLNIGSPITTGLGTQDLTYQGQSNPGVGGGLTNTADIAEYTTVNPTNTIGDQYNGRLDANLGAKDRASFAIYWVPFSQTDYNGSVRSYNLYHHNQTNDAFTGVWNHTFSPTFLNEARVNAAGWRWNEINDNPQEPFGLPADSIDAFGSIASGATGFGNFGAPGPSVFDQWTYTYQDTATKVLGSQSIRFGGEVTRLYYLNEATYSARPSYNFYNLWDFLNDAPHQEAGQFDPRTGTPTANRQDDREDIYGFFVQDDWKVRPSLTLNMGLRYSYFGSLSSKENNIDIVRFGTGAAQLTGLSIQQGGNLWTPQKGNFGPQFGFAWSPENLHNRFVLRGGFGLNYNQEEIAISGNVNGNPGQTVSPTYTSSGPTAINANIVYAVPSDVRTLFGYPANPHTVSTYNSAGLPTSGDVNLISYPTHLPTAYSEHFSLDTQTDVGHNIVFTAGYQATLGRHMINQQNQYIISAYHGIAFNPLVTSIGNFDNEDGSNYNALLLGLHHQSGHHVTLNADYTYAKSMDQGSGPYEEDPYSYDPRLAYGRSDYNFGQALKVYGLWQPVFFHGSHGWIEKVAGGWSVGGIFNLHTGFPWTPVYNAPNAYYYANSGITTVRPSAYFNNAGRSTSNRTYKSGPGDTNPTNTNFPEAAASASGALGPYFAAPASAAPPTFPGLGLFPTPGIARNSFTGPDYKQLDATLTKDFGLPNNRILGESALIEIRADATNLFNITNLKGVGASNGGSISDNIGSTDFGQAQSSLTGRVINLQARFSF